jgi:GntR family transcriptional repressor for pyruvate dehydrogenase complex
MALSRKTLSQSLAEVLLSGIREGRLQVGDRLPTESQLMDSYGVGRSVVREAMQSLAILGLVESRPRAGAVVTAPQARSVVNIVTLGSVIDAPLFDDLYEFRSVIEVAIARRAAATASTAQKADITAACDRYTKCHHLGLATSQADLDFHEAVARGANNQIYEEVVISTRAMLESARNRTQLLPDATELAEAQHRAITESISAGAVERAGAMMSEHIESAKWALQRARLVIDQDDS